MVARVVVLVGGFGRFVKADETTKAMTDLRAFRCQIMLDSLYDIPQNLSIVLGEEIFAVTIHLESWARIEEDGGDVPPAPPQNDQEAGNDPARGRGRNAQGNGDRGSGDEVMGEEAGELDEVRSERSVNRFVRNIPEKRTSSEPGATPVYGGQDALSTGKSNALFEGKQRLVASPCPEYCTKEEEHFV